jgi:catechol O-methyltransferase
MGTYCGYSAVALSQMLELAPVAPVQAPAGGACDGSGSGSGSGSEVLITFEKNPKAAEVSARILAAAGLTDYVTTHVCEAGSGAALHSGSILPGSVGLLFLDHEKSAYPADLRTWMASGLLAPRCVVLADNIHFQDCPHEEYLSLVRDSTHGFASSSFHASLIEYATHSEDVTDPAHPPRFRDGMELSVLV